MILLLCGITGVPSFPDSVTSQTPNSSFVIGVAVRSQLSGQYQCLACRIPFNVERTEIANQMSLNCVWRPFPVCDVSLVVHVEPELLVALIVLNIYLISFFESNPQQQCSRKRTHPAELLQPTLRVIDPLDPLLRISEPASQRVFVGLEPRVQLDDACPN